MFRLLGILFTVLLAIATAVVVWPQFFRLEQTYPFAQLVSARGIVLGGFLVVAVLALLLLFARPLREFAASVLIVALLGAGATAAIGAVRGFGDHHSRRRPRTVSACSPGTRREKRCLPR